MEEIDDEILQDLYTWVDHIPLSRPKRNMARDFSDAVLCAEVIRHHFPKMVEIHNYVPASSTKQKEDNWRLLNKKVLRKLNTELSEDVIKSLALARPYTVERVLLILRSKIDRTIFEKQRTQEVTRAPDVSDRPEADQHSSRQKAGHTTPGRTKPKPGGKPGLDTQSHTNLRVSRSTSPNPVQSRGRLTPTPSQCEGRLTPSREQNRTFPKPPPAKTNPNKILSKPKPPPKQLNTFGESTQARLIQGRPNMKIGSTNTTATASVKSAPTKPPSVPRTKVPQDPSKRAGEISIPVPKWPRANISAREVKEFTSDYTSRLAYEEKAQECLAKDETIEILNAKIRRLEHLVHLKDIRIEDLQARLEELRPTNKRH